MLKMIGLTLIFASSGEAGISMARAVRTQLTQLRALIDALCAVRCELQTRMTPLPEAFAQLPACDARVGAFFEALRSNLTAAQTCTVGYAYRQALRQTPGLQFSAPTRAALLVLFESLGKYDLDGNLQLLSMTAARLQTELAQLQTAGKARCKTYVTLGVCTGLAVAVILL